MLPALSISMFGSARCAGCRPRRWRRRPGPAGRRAAGAGGGADGRRQLDGALVVLRGALAKPQARSLSRPPSGRAGRPAPAGRRRRTPSPCRRAPSTLRISSLVVPDVVGVHVMVTVSLAETPLVDAGPAPRATAGCRTTPRRPRSCCQALLPRAGWCPRRWPSPSACGSPARSATGASWRGPAAPAPRRRRRPWRAGQGQWGGFVPWGPQTVEGGGRGARGCRRLTPQRPLCPPLSRIRPPGRVSSPSPVRPGGTAPTRAARRCGRSPARRCRGRRR